nr:hypothetical protein [Tanacetum cinerariifolium]
MPFGLTDAPTVFIYLMNRVCKPYLGNFLIVFIDDILINSKSKEDHKVQLKLVLELLKKEKLFAKFSKCEFLLKKYVFSDTWLTAMVFMWTLGRQKAVKNWKVPKTPSKIRSFSGLVGYYRRFIANFSKIAKLLTSLTQKNQKYEWGKEKNEAFQALKDNLCNALILSLLDGIKDCAIYYDVSNQGLGCVLMQRGKKELNMHQQRWIELFSDYDCEIRYHPGKANSSVMDKIMATQGKASKVWNVTTKMLHGLDQQMEKKEDGGLYSIDRELNSIDR